MWCQIAWLVPDMSGQSDNYMQLDLWHSQISNPDKRLRRSAQDPTFVGSCRVLPRRRLERFSLFGPFC